MEPIKVSRSSSWVYRFVHFVGVVYGEASESCELKSDLLKSVMGFAFLTMLCFWVSVWSTWSIILLYLVTFVIGWGVPPNMYLGDPLSDAFAAWLLCVLIVAVFFCFLWIKNRLDRRERRLGRPTVVTELYRTWRERFCKPIEYVD